LFDLSLGLTGQHAVDHLRGRSEIVRWFAQGGEPIARQGGRYRWTPQQGV
jgi:hypothetical protein